MVRRAALRDSNRRAAARHALAHAANRACEAFDFEGGAGDFTLDFTGDGLQPGAEADISVGMASLTLILPSGHPVVLDAPASFMTHVEVPPALARRGKGRWATPGAGTRAALNQSHGC